MKRLVAVVSVTMALLVPASAQAWTSNHFYSPSGNIECKWYGNNGSPFIACTTFNDKYVATIGTYGRWAHYSDDGSWGFSEYSSHYVLQYGQTYNAGNLRCHSGTAGMKCWSRATGHGFLLSRSTITHW